MRRFRLSLLCFFILILCYNSSAATIHGTVYDIGLDQVTNAAVEINTTPVQFMVAKNASYYFSVPIGTYVISAKKISKNSIDAAAEENITIKQNSDYIIDLILFPDVSLDSDISDDGLRDSFLSYNRYNNGIYIAIAVMFILAGILYLHYRKISERAPVRKEKEENLNKNEVDVDFQIKEESKIEENELDRIVEIIKKEGGRATQKEIRKQIPLSEAKISLMIAELEHKGVIEKIKKGRGNIIILKK